MSDKGFFDSIFDDEEEDPLLGGEDTPSEEQASQSSDSYEPPSWMDESDPSHGSTDDEPPEQKRIVVDQHVGHKRDLDELTQAIKEGWSLVRLSIEQSDHRAERTADRDSRQVVALLEQQGPKSLFDFGANR